MRLYDRCRVCAGEDGFALPWKDRLSIVERRETGIKEGRLSDGVAAPALDMGRGICDGDLGCAGVLRSDSRGVDGLDSSSPLSPTTTQLSAVRRRFALGRSILSLPRESIDLTP